MKNIYIVLSQTGTAVSSIIRSYTGDPYNHASISFDRSLDVMYSFGRKHRYNLLTSGFIEENFRRGMFAVFPETKCLVIEISVTEGQYDIMQATLGSFQDRKDLYRYNAVGLISYMFGVGVAPKDHFFCSQFVAHVLEGTELWPNIPELTKPMDFLGMLHNIVYEGNIRDFLLIQSPGLSDVSWQQRQYCPVLISQRLLARLNIAHRYRNWIGHVKTTPQYQILSNQLLLFKERRILDHYLGHARDGNGLNLDDSKQISRGD